MSVPESTCKNLVRGVLWRDRLRAKERREPAARGVGVAVGQVVHSKTRAQRARRRPDADVRPGRTFKAAPPEIP
ncbi:hypothetical protein GCM10010403_12390 [Glycomyces rutgersensis]|uniref:Uncharacterized protein n=1 Tax=Glycomyces rutgersensis TaxID=58115 RepID=A0ABN3F9B3_9ACTN